MKFFEYSECVALSWDEEKHIYGVKVKKVKDGNIRILDCVSSVTDTNDFSSNLFSVFSKLASPEYHLILAGGSIPGSVCFDLSVPRLASSELRQAIEYELPRHVPYKAENMIFGYRIIPDARNHETNKLHIRIVAVLKKQWDELIADIASSGIKVDSIIYPYMILDPLLGEESEIYIREIEPDFSYKKKGNRQMVKIARTGRKKKRIPQTNDLLNKINIDINTLPEGLKESELDKYIPGILLAAYGVSAEFRQDKSSHLPLFKELVPERFRKLRVSSVILAILLGVLLSGLIGRSWWGAGKRFSSIQNEKRKVMLKIEGLKRDNLKNKKLDELIENLGETNAGNNEIIHCLYELTTILPKEMWVTSFNSRDDLIDVNIITCEQEDIGNCVEKLNESGIITTKKVYKRANRDGSVNNNLSLQYLPPKTRGMENVE